MVKELIDGKLGQDRSMFVDREEGDDKVQKSGEFMEVRFTLMASSDEEMEELITSLRANPAVDPKTLNMS